MFEKAKQYIISIQFRLNKIWGKTLSGLSIVNSTLQRVYEELKNYIIQFFSLVFEFLKYIWFKVLAYEDFGLTRLPKEAIRPKPTGKESYWKLIKKRFPKVTGYLTAGLGSMTIVSGLANKIDISSLREDFILNFRQYTRNFWENIFSTFEIPYIKDISTYEYDLITLTTVAFSAVVYPSVLNLFDRTKSRKLISIWKYIRAIKGMKWYGIIVHYFKLIFTALFLFFFFTFLNFIDKLRYEIGVEVFKKEVTLFIASQIFKLFILVLIAVVFLMVKKLRKYLKYLIGVLFGFLFFSPFVYFFLAGFLPLEYFTYERGAQRLSIYFVTICATLNAIAFIRNWSVFGRIVFMSISIWITAELYQYLEPFWKDFISYFEDWFS
jgi:hypothetical protein